MDVAPFDSLDDFSQALARHEPRGPARVVCRLLRRAESACAGAGMPARSTRGRTTTTELRRALREADAQLYAHQVAAWTATAVPPPSRARTAPAIAACVGSGLMLIAAGEFMDGGGSTPASETAIVPPAPAARESDAGRSAGHSGQRQRSGSAASSSAPRRGAVMHRVCPPLNLGRYRASGRSPVAPRPLAGTARRTNTGGDRERARTRFGVSER